jgi:isoquinoline 1-oxidoreductase alpha subunit
VAFSIDVNGTRRSVEADGGKALLWVLRDELGLTGAKFGCGVGICGACTVTIDGKAVRSCQVRLQQVGNRKVVTIEGLGQTRLHPLQQAWMDLGVPQCGYCQPGQIMQAASLLREKPRPDDGDIDQAMSGNICRCGTYPRIRAAIKKASGQ